MRILLLILTLTTVSLVGCGRSFSAADKNSSQAFGSSIPYMIAPKLSDTNVAAVEVGCNDKVNQPCVSVTICQSGTTTCTTVDKILIDTGSYGLRIFESKLSSLSLPRVTLAGGGTLAECQGYLDNSSDWGPVAKADVGIGGLTASNIRIQLIQSTFGTVPASCTNPDTDPATAGFNGILGVGMFVDDCGAGCATTASNDVYYSCTGATCTGVTVAVADQVSNPVAFMPTDNNGVGLMISPSQPTGMLIMGIGTRPNNTPISVTVLKANANSGNFTTNFNGQSYPHSFIDSGSNGLFFPQPSSLTTCSSGIAQGWYCPSSTVSLSATQIGTNSMSVNVAFQITNAASLFNTIGNMFTTVGAPMASGFDWGFPFFVGRTIYVGMDGKSSSVASGTYWAY